MSHNAKSESERTPIEDLVANAAEDWVYAGEVLHIAHEYGVVDLDLRRDAAIGLIAAAMRRGLLLPGRPVGKDFVPWELNMADSLWRIVEDWSARDNPLVGPGEIVWLAVTPEGERMAREIWNREASR